MSYTSIELFAGAGGMALGFEAAGIDSVLLNELEHHPCNTMRNNRPGWNVVEANVADIDFTEYRGKVDIVAGGFPCQTFSTAGIRAGFEDTRGTLFYELARAVKEVQPKVLVAENVKGLTNHDGGNTLKVISSVIEELGYTLVAPRVLKAIHYNVPQKRERIFFIAVRNDLAGLAEFEWPREYDTIPTMRDALKAGSLYATDVPESIGQSYSEAKASILSRVPEGGNWKSLPEDVQKSYLGKAYYTSGGKTGIAKRLAWDAPCLTVTCSPAQKQTERCHPEETRPLTVREYARVQTFPDSWEFAGPITSQYKQIGNAVPVNLAHAVGKSLVTLLTKIQEIQQ